MRLLGLTLTLLLLSATGAARADMAPYPEDLSAEQDGTDVRIQVSINEDDPSTFAVLRVGDETVRVSNISYDRDGEVIASWGSGYNGWNRVEVVDQCVPVEGDSAAYTYEVAENWSHYPDTWVLASPELEVVDAGPCPEPPLTEGGCGASVSGSRTAAALPPVLGLLLVLAGVVTLRASRRDA